MAISRRAVTNYDDLRLVISLVRVALHNLRGRGQTPVPLVVDLHPLMSSGSSEQSLSRYPATAGRRPSETSCSTPYDGGASNPPNGLNVTIHFLGSNTAGYASQ